MFTTDALFLDHLHLHALGRTECSVDFAAKLGSLMKGEGLE